MGRKISLRGFAKLRAKARSRGDSGLFIAQVGERTLIKNSKQINSNDKN